MRASEQTDRDEALLELHYEEMADVAHATALLKCLSVAELRVLMAHYCGGKPSEYSDIRKPDLIGEIAPEYAREHL